MVVTSNDGIDELSITSTASVHELRHNEITAYEINFNDYDLSRCAIKEIQVETLEEAYLYGIGDLNGKRGPGFIQKWKRWLRYTYLIRLNQWQKGIEKLKRIAFAGLYYC